MDHFGGIEAGGTKFNCIIGESSGKILAECRIETQAPDPTLEKIVEFYETQTSALKIKLRSIGLGCFGPLDLRPGSPNFGSITSSPKISWRGINIPKILGEQLKVPIYIETDVNAAAFGEWKWGAGKNLDNLVYFTIGTGIGGGAIVEGKPIHGMLHPEMGHIYLKHDWQKDPFPGNCPFHQDCFEGLASGPAIKARWKIEGEQLPDDHPAWIIESIYIAQALQAVILVLSPLRIILGGGVMQRLHLFPLIRQELSHLLNGYVQTDELLHGMENYIVPPELGQRSGVLGSLALAIKYSS